MQLPNELIPLKNKLREIALEPTLDGPHSAPNAVLYHYTTPKGLKGILGSGMIRATCLPDLKDKDKRETEYPISSCRKFLLRKAKTDTKGNGDMRYEFLGDVYHLHEDALEFAHCLEKQAAACFSKKTNLRKQWKDYADGGAGYALGFRSYGLLECLASRTKDPNSSTEPNWIPRAMIYDSTEQERLLNRIIEEIFTSRFFPEPGTVDIGNGLTALAVHALGRAACQFKSIEFASENEVRLAIANHVELHVAGTDLFSQARTSEQGKRYLEVPLWHAETGALPLVEVIIGPEANLESVVEILGKDSGVQIRRISWDEMQ